MRKTDDKVDKMMARMEDAVSQVKDFINKHELEPYLLKDGQIDGDKVDEDENITAQQVAVLGAYSTLYQVRDDLKRIVKGEDKPTVEVFTIDPKTGKKESVDRKDLPAEIKKLLRDLGEDNE